MLKRFLSKIDIDDNGCWLWTGGVRSDGYVRVRDGGKKHYVHRLLYKLMKGDIPEGLQLDHLCRRRHCVNPDHLEPVTQRENILRGEGLAAREARQTHCIRGHEFATGDTYDYNGWRVCRTCNRVRNAAYRMRKRATTQPPTGA